MLEALLTVIDLPPFPVVDAIDIYEGSLPSAATFSTIDPNIVTETPPDPEEDNVNPT